jgi:hypothetical protein
MRKFLYYRNGIQISAVDALDERGNLKDGVTQRTPLMLRDSRLTDGTGNCSELAFSRPGWCVLADASVNDALETAYAEYLDDLTNAWRNKPRA